MSINGQATKLSAVEGTFVASDLAFVPPDNQIVNSQGEPVHTRLSLMARIDEKLTEKTGWSNGTVLLVSLILPAVMVVFYWGSSLLGVARDDQQQKLQIQQLQNDMDSMKGDVKDIKKTLQALEVKEAYKLGAGTAHENERPKN
jgi:hypothetical protein